MYGNSNIKNLEAAKHQPKVECIDFPQATLQGDTTKTQHAYDCPKLPAQAVWPPSATGESQAGPQFGRNARA